MRLGTGARLIYVQGKVYRHEYCRRAGKSFVGKTPYNVLGQYYAIGSLDILFRVALLIFPQHFLLPRGLDVQKGSVVRSKRMTCHADGA